MKTTKNIILNAFFLILIFLLSGCVAFVAFEKPQPFFKKNELRFDEKIQGVYYDSLDDRLLEITPTAMLISSDHLPKVIPVNEIHSISNAGIIEASIAEPSKVNIPNLTVYTMEGKEEIDTVFFISDDQVLRRFRGNYYLNYKESDKYWYLERMALERGNRLSISTVYVEDLTTLEEEVPLIKIRNKKGEIVKVVLQPNKKQLKKLMRTKAYQMELFVGHKMNVK